MKKVLILTAFVCITWISFLGAADDRQKIQAIGMATIHNNFKDIARDKAIDNALRNVVERVVGVMVMGSTEVENFQVKMDRILSESKGFVDNYKILSERINGENYEVTVEAEVGAGKLQDRLKAIDLVVSRKSKPRLMIVFSETGQKDAVAEAAITKFFLGKNFKVVDSETLKKNRGDLNSAMSSGSGKALSNLARSYGAEVVIAGSVEAVSSSFNVMGMEMNNNKVTVSLKVINSDSGDIITTGSESKSSPGAKGEINSLTEESTIKLARKILDETLDRWSSELTNTTTVKLVVNGLDDYQDLIGFKDHLPLVVKGFKALYQRNYQQGAADLDIEIKGNIQGVADDLSAIVLKGRKIRITAITQSIINATLLP